MQAVLAVVAVLAAAVPATAPLVAPAVDAPLAGAIDALVAAPLAAVSGVAAATVEPIADSVAVAEDVEADARWPDAYRYHRHEATFFEDPMLDDVVCGARADGCDPRRAGFAGEWSALQ